MCKESTKTSFEIGRGIIMSSEDLSIEDLEIKHFMLGVKKKQRRAIMDGLSKCEFFREFLSSYTIEYNHFNRTVRLVRKRDNRVLAEWEMSI